MKRTLTIVWRAGGIESREFENEADAIKEMHLMELCIGTKIVEMSLN